MFWAFILLTVFSMVMENTGLLKAGPGPVEFEAEEGKVVRFSDVHGCEEAKSVSGPRDSGCVMARKKEI
jgi:ATP-dependent metalloprotease